MVIHYVDSEANSDGGSGDCAGRRTGECVKRNDGARERCNVVVQFDGKSVWGEQRAVAGEVAGSAAAAGVSVLDRIGIYAAAGSAADQAGAPILARVAIFVVERAGPELAPSVRAENDGRFVDRGFAALRVRNEYLSGVWIVIGIRAFAGCAEGAIFSFVGASGRRWGGRGGGDGRGG